jgi:phospholipid/cholesterol/gamma-HCH transport system permease protein
MKTLKPELPTGADDRVKEILFLMGETVFACFFIRRGGFQFLSFHFVQQIYFTGMQCLITSGLLGVMVGLMVIIPLVSLDIQQLEILRIVYDAAVYHTLIPILMVLLVIGRSGNAITSELGMFRINGTLESLASMGIEPYHFLVLPRFLAMVMSLFILYVWTTLWSIICVATVAVIQLNASMAGIVKVMLNNMQIQDFLLTFVLLAYIAFTIVVIHCYFGLTATSKIMIARNLPLAFISSFFSSLTIVIVFSVIRHG